MNEFRPVKDLFGRNKMAVKRTKNATIRNKKVPNGLGKLRWYR